MKLWLLPFIALLAVAAVSAYNEYQFPFTANATPTIGSYAWTEVGSPTYGASGVDGGAPNTGNYLVSTQPVIPLEHYGGNWTMSFEMTLSDNSSTWQDLLYQSSVGLLEIAYGDYFSNGTSQILVQTDAVGGQLIVYSDLDPILGQQYLINLTSTDGRIQMFVDGVLAGTGTDQSGVEERIMGAPVEQGSDVRLLNDPYDDFFSGSVKNLRVTLGTQPLEAPSCAPNLPCNPLGVGGSVGGGGAAPAVSPQVLAPQAAIGESQPSTSGFSLGDWLTGVWDKIAFWRQ